MKVEYNRTVCSGWFQCLDHWDELEMNVADGKADLPNSEETNEGIFICKVPEAQESDVWKAAEACPTNAIKLYKDGEQVYPSSG